MSLTRRSFIKGIAASVGALAVLPLMPVLDKQDPKPLTAEGFGTIQVGEVFTIQGISGKFEVTNIIRSNGSVKVDFTKKANLI